MPLYLYECKTCGPIEAKVPLASSDTEITCPVCEYNDYLLAHDGAELTFSGWVEVEWEKTWKKNGGDGKHVLRKVPTTVGLIKVG